MMKQLLEFKNNLQLKEIKTEGNSLGISGFFGRINDEGLKTIENHQNLTQLYTESDKIFTPPQMLEDIKTFSHSNSKSKIYDTPK